MEKIVIKGQSREVVGKQVKVLRREGRLPCIVYGRGFKPVLITLNMREASRILPTITSSQLLVVEVDGKQHTTLVREKQRDPVTGMFLHVDFLEVSLTEKLRANVQIELVGDSPAVKNYNGVLVSSLEEIAVEALPSDLPERITIDISILTEIGQAVHVRDIVLPSVVEILDDPEEIIVVITAPAREEEEVAAEGTAFEPEVIERGKKEEEI
jgi:large subunit ribosomal protein L25